MRAPKQAVCDYRSVGQRMAAISFDEQYDLLTCPNVVAQRGVRVFDPGPV